MSTRLSLSLDRFEGKGKEIAVLLTDDGETLNIPRSLLPAGSKPGDVLTLSLEHDAGATRNWPTRLATSMTSSKSAIPEATSSYDIQAANP